VQYVGLIELLENTGVAVWVRESPSIFAYIFILSLHALGLAIVVGLSSALALRILGVARDIPLAPMAKLYPLMYLGFTINALSGLLLFAANASGMLANFMFYIKIAFIAVAFVLMVLLQRRFRAGTEHAARGLAFGMMGCWLVAIIAGRLVSYPYFVATWLGL
jgi:hypothetical protein